MPLAGPCQAARYLHGTPSFRKCGQAGRVTTFDREDGSAVAHILCRRHQRAINKVTVWLVVGPGGIWTKPPTV
jgi:hypothetical protein